VTFKRCVGVVLLAALLAIVVRPAPAEALEPMTIMLIVGAGVAVILLVAVVVIANVAEKRPRTSQVAEALAAPPPLLALPTPVTENP
jgi:hypothetical protein